VSLETIRSTRLGIVILEAKKDPNVDIPLVVPFVAAVVVVVDVVVVVCHPIVRTRRGLCYLRLPHSAGATLKGINMRIASNFAKRHDVENCIRHDASHSVGIHYVRRHKKSYLWTFVRDPTDRAMSAIGSKLSKELLGPNNRDAFDARNFTNDTTSSLGVDDDLNKRFLASKVMPLLQNSSHIHEGVVSEGRGGFQLQFGMQRYIKANHHFDPLYPSEIQNQDYLLTNVRQFVHAYDFVGVVERFDESLVAMQLLLGLETSDMLYFAVNRKEQWHRSKLAHKQYGCRKPFDWETDLVADASVRNYLATSRHWYARNYGDYLLYQTAALSLDRTILDIGLDVFSVELKRFRALLKRAHEECTPINWCSPNGTNQYNESLRDCMDEGRIGCGYRCLDGLASS